MLKKSITYENFAGDEVTEDFYFHLSKSDFIELSVDGLGDRIQAIGEGKITNQGDILEAVKQLLLRAIGERSEDGKSFVKTEAIRDAFANSDAFGELVLSLLQDETQMQTFFVGMLPKSLQSQVLGEIPVPDTPKTPQGSALPNLENVGSVPNPEMGVITRAEALTMESGELQHKLAGGWTIEPERFL